MKTLTLRKADSTVAVMIKADIFARNSELMTAGFDTRFTNMTLEGYDDAAKALINIQQIEDGWQSIIALAKATPKIGLYLFDLSDAAPSAPVAQVEQLTIAGNTDGTATITVGVDGVDADYLATFATSPTVTASNFDTAHSAALTTAGVECTNSSGVLSFAPADTTKATEISIANVTGTLAGVVKANVAVTGTSGTANININGVDYLATYNTSATVTADDFRIAHEAALLAAGVVVTDLIGVLTFTPSDTNGPLAVYVTPATGNLDGTISMIITLANPAPTMNVVVDGVDYLATWNTDATTTASDFDTTHSAALTTAGLTCTNAAGVLTFTANTAGKEFGLATEVIDGNISGTHTTVTVNNSGTGEIMVVSPNH